MWPQIRSHFAQQHSFIRPSLGRSWNAMNRDGLRKRPHEIRIGIGAVGRPVLANDSRLPAILREKLGETACPITGDVVAGRKIKSEQ
jgi:hypothetical protein